MQVLFLLYHYFEARELYNAIRIFIAGYVWMTGFGNFSYYYRTRRLQHWKVRSNGAVQSSVGVRRADPDTPTDG